MKNRKRFVAILAGIMAGIMILSLLLSILPTRAWAASSSEIRKQINALQQDRKDIKTQIADLKEQYQATTDEIADMVERKNIIDQEIGLLHTEIININEQLSAYSVLIADQQEELDLKYTTLELAQRTRTARPASRPWRRRAPSPIGRSSSRPTASPIFWTG